MLILPSASLMDVGRSKSRHGGRRLTILGTGLRAAVNVAVTNTVHVFTHPVHTAKTIISLEKDKSIPEMLHGEEARLTRKRHQV
jgi:hypothetical protein